MTSNCQVYPGCPTAFTSFFPNLSAGIPLPVRIRRTDAPRPAVLSVLHLQEVDDLLRRPDGPGTSSQLLSSREQKIYRGFAYAKRRREWLGGRLACKAALIDLLQGSAPGPAFLPILASPTGAPALETFPGGTARRPAISISHSRDYAAAVAAGTAGCGIDIQVITGRTERVRQRFATEAELEILRCSTFHLSEAERLTLLWSAKEAVKKSLFPEQPGFLQHLVLQSLGAAGDWYSLCFSCPGRQTAARAVLLEGYALAFTVREDTHA